MFSGIIICIIAVFLSALLIMFLTSYEKIGYARPVVLDRNGAWEAVLENAYDIIVTGEINDIGREHD